MSPKGKQARQSQRKKAQQKLKLLEQNEESFDSENGGTMNFDANQNQKKRLRENESEDQQALEKDTGMEHKSKKSSVEDSMLRSKEDAPPMVSPPSSSPEPEDDDGNDDPNLIEKVTDPVSHENSSQPLP